MKPLPHQYAPTVTLIAACEQTLKRFDDELKTLKNWNGEVEKLRKEMELVGAVNIVEREEQVTKEGKIKIMPFLLSLAVILIFVFV